MGEQAPLTGEKVTHTDRQIALVVLALAAGLYLREVAPDLLAGDAGEFQFAAWQWGLAHPTGYPLYLLLGGLWQRLWALFGVSPALSLNALSALFAGGAAALFYLLLLGWLPPARPAVRRLAAGLGVAMLVVNPTLRTQSIQAEIYTLHLLFIVAILLAAQALVARSSISNLQSPAPNTAVVGHAHDRRRARRQVTLALLVGLALTHHATTLLLLPALLLYLWLTDRAWWRPVRAWPWSLLALTTPLLLYLYIPLRAGPDVSPWLHQRLGAGVLTLYDGTWPAFLDYVTGRAISVGFTDLNGAVANAPTAALLWLRHFEWPGLLLMAIGLFVLVRVRQWPVLALTLVYALTQQIFNLFYAIGDIFVYYLPAYLMACIWIAFAGAGIGLAFRFTAKDAAAPPSRVGQWSLVLLVLLYWAPLQFWGRYTPLVQQVQAQSSAARARWEAILVAAPSDDAILVSNDRDDLVPFFYLQAVEGRGVDHTGLFPLIAPDARFRDIGATVQTALNAGDQPVYLIKPMPGLEVRFDLAEAAPPLVQVLGAASTAPPAVVVDAVYGPLRLLGYDWTRAADAVDVTLHWQVNESLAADYTATVQIFDGVGEKLGQDDRPPGGDYYPTSLWQVGETLVDRRTVALPTGAQPATMLLGFYDENQTMLAPPLELPLAQ
jgi:hypothetical protein